MTNRTIEGLQHTIRYHVDDVITSHLLAKVNDDFASWADKVYGKLKKVEVHRGKIHEYLGMKLDFEREAGKVHVPKDGHVNDIIETWPEKLKPTQVLRTPAGTDLFDRRRGRLLGKTERESCFIR